MWHNANQDYTKLALTVSKIACDLSQTINRQHGLKALTPPTLVMLACMKILLFLYKYICQMSDEGAETHSVRWLRFIQTKPEQLYMSFASAKYCKTVDNVVF